MHYYHDLITKAHCLDNYDDVLENVIWKNNKFLQLICTTIHGNCDIASCRKSWIYSCIKIPTVKEINHFLEKIGNKLCSTVQHNNILFHPPFNDQHALVYLLSAIASSCLCVIIVIIKLKMFDIIRHWSTLCVQRMNAW